jgi:RimJ/RimL family protein N-acetyltransferase
MMPTTDLKFVSFEKKDFALYALWCEDAEAKHWLSTPDEQWLNYVLTSSGVFVWMVYEDTTPVGQIHVDVSDEGTQASISFLVPYAKRRQGYGCRMLQAMLSHPALATVQRFEAGVLPANTASARLLTKVGFKLASSEVDDEGFLTYLFLRK